MKKLIGFANVYYTLWNYEAVKNYATSANGQHFLTSVSHRYYYIKNISTELSEVKRQYPDLEIDMSLRGTTQFVRNEYIPLPEDHFWRGKYTGKPISEIIETDFKYCLWAADNMGGPVAEQISLHPKFIKYHADIEDAKQKILNATPTLKDGDTVTLDFVSNGFNYDEEDGTACFNAKFGDVDVVVVSDAKPVYGKYPYFLMVLNGKGKRTRGKQFEVTISNASTPSVTQLDTNPRINQIVMLKHTKSPRYSWI